MSPALRQRLGDNTFLQEVESAGCWVRRLLDGSEEESVQFGMFLFDLARDGLVIGMPFARFAPGPDGGDQSYGRQERQREAGKISERGLEEEQGKSEDNQDTPTKGQALSSFVPPLLPCDWFKLRLKKCFSHNIRDLSTTSFYTPRAEKQ